MIRKFEDIQSNIREKADVCVIGSGAGGAVVAKELAENGYSVVLLEEGGYYTSKDFNCESFEMIKKLYRDAGTSMIMGKPNIIFSEGRCVGGSTVINAGICWRIPRRALERWHWEAGLWELTPEHLEPYFEKVEEFISVREQPLETIGKDVHLIKRGAERLGYKTSPVKRNQKDCKGSNFCIFGCPLDAKQSTLITYIPRASELGTKIYANCRADKIRISKGRATGVTGYFIDPLTGNSLYQVDVEAKVVIVAGGAIQTPGLLLKNRLQHKSRMVGKNFLCHPNAKAVGIFDEDVYGWKGTVQGWQIHEFIDEGIILSTTFVPPGPLAMSLPYYGEQSLEVMQDYNRMVAAGVLVEDTGTGRIFLGPGRKPIPYYKINQHDTRQLIRGIAILSEIYFAGGARSVLLPFAQLPEIHSREEISKIYDMKIKPNDIEILTMHAMGTCTMGANPRRSVVDQYGESHDYKNLFIADASIFPAPIGVNPQLTIMALATRIADYIHSHSQSYFY